MKNTQKKENTSMLTAANEKLSLRDSADRLGPVVQRLDNAIHRINRYPADKC